METWVNVKNFEHYQVSNLGRIRRNGHILSGGLDPDGYRTVLLYPIPTGKRKNVRIHRLIAEHFLDNQNNYPQINHINGIKDDNRAENLEWITAKRNVQHSIQLGLRTDESKNKPVAKCDSKTGEILKIYPSIKATIADGFLRNNVGACCRNERGRKTHKGFVWKFLETCND